jgi:hypothetical protein
VVLLFSPLNTGTMKLMILAIFFYFISTTLVESVIISALIGFKIGYALASRNRGHGHGRRSHGRSRWGRSIEDTADDNAIEQVMLQASVQDNDDCAKAFVCYVHAKPTRTTAMEEFVFDYFGGNSKDTAMLKALVPQTSEGSTVLDVLSPTVQFDLAAEIGTVGGAETCQKIYAQCPMPYSELSKILEGKLTPAPQPVELGVVPEQH